MNLDSLINKKNPVNLKDWWSIIICLQHRFDQNGLFKLPPLCEKRTNVVCTGVFASLKCLWCKETNRHAENISNFKYFKLIRNT